MDKGNVKIRSKDGTDVTITNVFFVLEFVEYRTINKKKGHIINISNGVCTLSDKNKKMIAKVQMIKNMMFPMFLKAETLFSLKTIVEDNNWL